MIPSINKFFLFFIILALFQNCSEDTSNCDSTNISANIQMRKTNELCSDLDLLFDISFGVNLEFEIDIQCTGDCSDRIIFYQKREFLKNLFGTTEFNPGSITKAFYTCNKLSFPTLTLNTKIDDPDPINFALGDTILFEFFDPGLCLTNDYSDCSSNYLPISLPDFSIEYILAPEDFDCD